MLYTIEDDLNADDGAEFVAAVEDYLAKVVKLDEYDTDES